MSCNRLNAAHVDGVVFVAGLLGRATESGTYFLRADAALFVTGHAGDGRTSR